MPEGLEVILHELAAKKFVETLYSELFPDYQMLESNMAFVTFHRYHINYLLPVLFQYLSIMLRPNEEWGTVFCERFYRIDECDQESTGFYK